MAANQRKDCMRNEKRKTRKGSHQDCFEPVKKQYISSLDISDNSLVPKEKVTFHSCRRCGKRLKSTDSIALGFGPTCYKRFILSITNNRRPLF